MVRALQEDWAHLGRGGRKSEGRRRGCAFREDGLHSARPQRHLRTVCGFQVLVRACLLCVMFQSHCPPRRYKVSGFPTLRVISPEGKPIKDFRGGRDVDGVLAYARKIAVCVCKLCECTVQVCVRACMCVCCVSVCVCVV